MVDELTPIANYMAKEMSDNIKGKDVLRMSQFNRFSSTECIADYTKLPIWKQLLGFGITPQQCMDTEMSYSSAALIIWAANVRQDGDWDHKPKIRKKFHPRVPNGEQVWHAYDKTLYYYDTWSNVHYGYVGEAAGFSDASLLDGAGLEQIGSDIFRGKMPTSSPDVDGLRKWDDKHDRAAINIGINLYKVSPGGITSSQLLWAILNSSEVEQKPYISK